MKKIESKPEVVFDQRCQSIEGLDHLHVCKLLERAWQVFDGPKSSKVNVVLTDMKEHCALHEEFLNDATPTDVMAFPYKDSDLFGEIIVNREMAISQAPQQKHCVLAEISLYIVHGALHLLGFDDTCLASREKMRTAEQEVLFVFGDFS